MDDKNISLLISLMRAGITGQPIGEGIKENFTEDALNEVMKIAARHDIGYIVGTGITASGLCEKGSETYEKIKKLQMSAYFRYERMKYDMQEIAAAFSGAKIPFIPLKGAVIRKYYPDPLMRTSCDIDVLVHEKDLENAAEYLVKNYG